MNAAVFARPGDGAHAAWPGGFAAHPVLASYSKLVAELLSKGVLIYMLNIFCNSNNSDNRQGAAGVCSKLIADKVPDPGGTTQRSQRRGR